jgi:hypothetical protein
VRTSNEQPILLCCGVTRVMSATLQSRAFMMRVLPDRN